MEVYFAKITNIFTTRELAIAIWILIAIIYFAMDKQFRVSAKNLFKSLSAPAFVVVYIVLFIYLLIITFILGQISLWNISLIKDSIFWFVFSGIVLCLNNSDLTSMKNTFMQNLKATVLLESIVNTYTFNLGFELLIIPLISIIVMLNVYSETQAKYKSAKKLTDNMLFGIGILTLSYCLYAVYLHFNEITRLDFLRKILLPIIYTAFFIIPAVLLKIYSEYESSFDVLSNCCKGYNRKADICLFLKLFSLCKLNFKRLKNIVNQAICSDYSLNTKEDINSFINLYLKREQLLPFNSMLKGFDTKEATLYLLEEGLIPDNYRYNGFDDGFGEYYDTSTKSLELIDILKYSVEGTNQSIQKLHLGFHEFIFSGEKNENYNYFFDCAIKLYNKAFNSEIPNQIILKLKKRKNGEYIIGDYKIIIKKEKFPNNKRLTSYKFIIQINKTNHKA